MNWSFGRSVVIHILPLTNRGLRPSLNVAVYRPSELRRNYQLLQELITSPVCIASSYVGGKIAGRPSLTVGDQPGAVGRFESDLRVGGTHEDQDDDYGDKQGQNTLPNLDRISSKPISEKAKPQREQENKH